MSKKGILFVTSILLISVVGAAVFEDNIQQNFDAGAYFRTFYNSSGFLQVNVSQGFLSGNFTSRIFSSQNASWQNVSWTQGSCYGCELSNGSITETGDFVRRANMSGNVLLVHLNEATTPVFDSSGNGNNGTCTAANCPASSTTSKFGRAFDFETSGPSDDYLNFSNPSLLDNFGNSLSVEAWIRPESFPANDPTIADKDFQSQFSFFIATPENSIAAYVVNSSGGSRNLVGNRTLSIATWYHVAFVYDGSDIRLYVDGSLDGTPVSQSGNVATSSKAFLVGSGWNGNNPLTFPFDGLIDEVAVFNRSLSAQEIKDHYLRGAGRLNVSVRSCDDSLCSGENFVTLNNSSPQSLILANNSYFQYKVDLSTENVSTSPEFYNFSVNYLMGDLSPPQFSNFTEFPSNGSIYTENGIYSFNSTINESNLFRAGIEFDGVNYSVSNISNAYNFTILNLAAGNYNYYWWANDTNGNYNTSGVRSYTISKANQSITSLLNGVNSNLGITYPQQINASFSGTNQTVLSISLNGSLLNVGQNYTFGAGIWTVNYSSPSNQNYSAYDSTLILTVSKTLGEVNGTINGTRSNFTSANGELQNILLIASNVSGSGRGQIYLNGTLINNGTLPISNNSNLSVGFYNVTFVYEGNQNYTSDDEVWFVNVSEPVDETVPSLDSFIETPASPTDYFPGTSYQFNASASDENLEFVGIEFDGNSHPVSNLSNVYNFSVSDLGAGVYEYYWFANDSFGNYNFSEVRSYVINKSLGNVSLLINGSGENQTAIFGTPTNVSAATIYGGLSLYRNGVDVDAENNQFVILGAGDWNYTSVSSGNANYSAEFLTRWVHISRAASEINLTLNGSEGNITVSQGSTIVLNATRISGDSGGTLRIYNNGTLINQQTTTSISNSTTFNNVGLHNITAFYISSQNYTTSSETYFVNVVEIGNNLSSIILNSPANNSVVNLSSVILNASVFDEDLNNMSVWIYGNDIILNVSYNVSDGESVIFNWSNLSAGNYNWSVIAFDGFSNSTQEYGFFSVLGSGETPSIEIFYPSYASVYGNNNSIQLNYSADSSDLDSCWYTTDNGATNNSISGCGNITFSRETGFYNLTLYANESSSGKQNSSSVLFYVDSGKPSVHLLSPTENLYVNYTEIDFSFIPFSSTVSSCSLYGNFNGTYSLNSTINSPTTGSENIFSLNLSAGSYFWAVNCQNSTTSSTSGNRTLNIDVESPNITQLSSPPSVFEGNAEFQYNITDASPTNCIFTIDEISSAGELVVNNFSSCTNIIVKYDVSLPTGSYQGDFKAVDAAGNSNSVPAILFAVAASSGSSGGGGGGGGGVTGTIVLLGEPDLVITSGTNHNFRKGETKRFALEVRNDGGKYANSCSVEFSGNAADWFSGDEINSVGAGEKVTYQFDVNIPSSVQAGTYGLNAVVNCDETEVAGNFVIEVFVNDFEAEIINYERVGNNLVVDYSVREFVGENHEIEIVFSLLDLDGIATYRGIKSISLNSLEILEDQIIFDLPKDSFGEFVFEMELNDGSAEVTTSREVFLSSQNTISGFAISDSNKQALKFVGGIVLVGIFVFAGIYFFRKMRRKLSRPRYHHRPLRHHRFL